MQNRNRLSLRLLATLMPTLVLMSPAVNAESDQPAYDGTDLYLNNCANCHGVYGEGDGIVTPTLSTVLLDLRYLSARNDGTFPRDFVTDIIDGRATRATHGPEGMPVWAAEFSRQEGFDEQAEARVTAKIDALVNFLEQIQRQ
ncbi:MAG: cytochrome c [Gammaproteobacteria bacterium]|nr:cytochrome c [Gammaproteobacteria bacterium]